MKIRGWVSPTHREIQLTPLPVSGTLLPVPQRLREVLACRFPQSMPLVLPSSTPNSNFFSRSAWRSGRSLRWLGFLPVNSVRGDATAAISKCQPIPVAGSVLWISVCPSVNPVLFASLIALLIVLGIVFWILFLYVSSVMRFILFDSVIAKHCEIRRGWARRHGAGLRYFVWQLLFLLAMVVGLTVLVGIPAAFAFAAGLA